VCPSGAHSPIAWRRLQKRDAWAAAACTDPTLVGRELLDDALSRALPGALTWESYVTSATILNHIQRQPRASGGALQLTRQGV
jgi:hypothetical protein